MDITERIVREVKGVAKDQEEIHGDIGNLKGQIAMEQQSLDLIKSQVDAQKLQLEYLTKTEAELARREDMMIKLRETLNLSIASKAYLKRCVAMLEPSEEQQGLEFERLKSIYGKMIQAYEENPEYRRVVEATKKTQEFEEMINQQRARYMELEAAENELAGPTQV